MLSQCNGERPAKQIADMLSSASTEFRDEEGLQHPRPFQKERLDLLTFELHIDSSGVDA